MMNAPPLRHNVLREIDPVVRKTDKEAQAFLATISSSRAYDLGLLVGCVMAGRYLALEAQTSLVPSKLPATTKAKDHRAELLLLEEMREYAMMMAERIANGAPLERALIESDL